MVVYWVTSEEATGSCRSLDFFKSIAMVLSIYLSNLLAKNILFRKFSLKIFPSAEINLKFKGETSLGTFINPGKFEKLIRMTGGFPDTALSSLSGDLTSWSRSAHIFYKLPALLLSTISSPALAFFYCQRQENVLHPCCVVSH